MRSIRRFAVLFVLLPLVAGCSRYKGWESFTSATNMNPPTQWKGDAYSFGSVAPASGGLLARTNYGAGANEKSTAKVNPVLDQPEKGSGQEPGQYPNTAAPGYGQDNGPALQPQPGSLARDGAFAHG